MKILGLRFAPWKIPLRRRFQMLAVVYMGVSFTSFGLLGSLIVLYLFFTPYYFLSFMYLTWLYYDWDKPREGGRPSKIIRNSRYWRHYANYFPVQMIKTADLDPSKNYVVGFHPHGIMVAGAPSVFLSEATGFGQAFPDIKPRLCTLDGNFKFPLHREILMWMGFCSVSRDSIEWILTKEGKGNAVVIVVGGAAEALDARPGEATLTIKNRKGFVRMAITQGASLVPVYSFGENDLFNQVYNPVGSPLRMIQDKMTKFFGVSPPIFHGRGIFNYTMGFFPHRRPIYTIIGKPIDVEKNPLPTKEQVDKVHSLYLQQLKEIYDRYKNKYGNPEHELLFI